MGTMDNNAYIYLVIEREFRNSTKQIGKIGRTENLNQRMKQYPNDSVMVAATLVRDAKQAESALKSAFLGSFEQQRRIGSEYFAGSLSTMFLVFQQVASQYLPSKCPFVVEQDEPEMPMVAEEEASSIDVNAVTVTGTDTIEETEETPPVVHVPEEGKKRSKKQHIDMDVLVCSFINNIRAEREAKKYLVNDLLTEFNSGLDRGAIEMNRFVSSIRKQFGIEPRPGPYGATIVISKPPTQAPGAKEDAVDPVARFVLENVKRSPADFFTLVQAADRYIRYKYGISTSNLRKNLERSLQTTVVAKKRLPGNKSCTNAFMGFTLVPETDLNITNEELTC